MHPQTSESTYRQSREGNWEEIIGLPGDSWNLDHVRSCILDAEEKLHLQSIWRKAELVVLFFVNTGLIGVTVVVAASLEKSDRVFLVLSVVAAVISIGLSTGLIYWRYKRVRSTRMFIRKLHLVRRRLQLGEADDGAQEDQAILKNQKRYREDIPDLVTQYREESNRTRRTHNRFQSVIIIGSTATSVITTASVSFGGVRWIAVGAGAAVALAAGFVGYYKFHERAFNLQVTADAIEREYEAVELRVGRYAGKKDPEAYALFADVVERLRDEQNKRQQQLD